jgi:hypothetical protein
MLRVTQLEPRTPRQPEKLKKLSKNDSVVRFLILESMKSALLYLIYFQRSAGHPQPGDRILCTLPQPLRARSRRDAGFRDADRACNVRGGFLQPSSGCENLVKAAPDKGSPKSCVITPFAVPALKSSGFTRILIAKGLIP